MSASPNPSDPPRGAPPRALTRLPLVGPLFASLRQEDPADNPFALAALERHKKQGMALALRARFIAMVIIAATLPFINAQWSVIWYEFLVLGFIGIGLLQQRVARVGQSRAEILLIWADVILMTITLLVPNPLGDEARPLAMQFRAGGFVFFFILLAFATLAYSWRTVWGLGVMASGAWLAGYAYIEFFGYEDPALGDAANSVFTSLGGEVFWVDPNSAMGFVRVQEVVAFLIVAAVLGVIKTMGSIDQPPEVLGKLIGGALVGTFLGVFLAYAIVGPCATKLKNIVDSEHHFYNLIREVLVANLYNHAPDICIEVGRQNTPGSVRPSWAGSRSSTGSRPTTRQLSLARTDSASRSANEAVEVLGGVVTWGSASPGRGRPPRAWSRRPS